MNQQLLGPLQAMNGYLLSNLEHIENSYRPKVYALDSLPLVSNLFSGFNLYLSKNHQLKSLVYF